MPIAQVELMCLDGALTVYDKTDSVKDAKGKEHKFSRPSQRAMEEMRAKFEKWDDVVNPTVDISGFNFAKK